MFRIGLSVYLMFATLVGPYLCCCQLPRFSDRLVALLHNERTKPVESRQCCCQHHVPDVPVKDSQPANSPKPPWCPCQSNHPSLVLLDSDGTRQLYRDSNAQTVDLLDCDFVSGVVMPSVGPMLTASLLSSPVLTTGRDILSSLHILRC